MEEAQSGDPIRRKKDAHPENHNIDEATYRAILAEPDAVYLSSGKERNDRGAPITHTQITTGTIPVAPGKPPIAPAEQIWP